MGKHKKKHNKPSPGSGRETRKINHPPSQAAPQNATTATHPLLKQSWFWTAVLFPISIGFSIVVPNADSPAVVYCGWFLWGLTVALFLVGVWQQLKSPRWAKLLLVLASASVFLWAAHRSIIERLKPSFVYISPGVIFNGDTWDFIANHRGSRTSFSVQMLFIDEDRKDYLSRTQTSFTPADVTSYQTLWSLPEVNPMGRGNIFAQQLLWKPFNLPRSRFTVEITWRDGGVHEELQIARVNEKWQYAMQVSDRESKKRLLWCRDKEFPSSEVLPPCFPDITQGGE
jgi:hypothetical protein